MFSRFPRIYYSVGLILFIVCFGTIGFMAVEGFNFLDAFYMTIITISTVGFGEVEPLSDSGKMFATFLIITNLGTFAYALSSISRYFFDGDFAIYFKNRNMNTKIQALSGHVVVCGYGRNGRQAAQHLNDHKRSFVVIERKEGHIEKLKERGWLYIEGDATNDDVLLKTNIENAAALIVTLPDDADNLFIVLTAKSINPKLTIISRASNDHSDRKLKVAGANNVIMPDKIGGAHMASLVTQPNVMEFIDYITGQGDESISLEEIVLESIPDDLSNKTIKDIDIRKISGANIVGMKKKDGMYTLNPSADTVLETGVRLFVLGTSDQISSLKKIFLN